MPWNSLQTKHCLFAQKDIRSRETTFLEEKPKPQMPLSLPCFLMGA